MKCAAIVTHGSSRAARAVCELTVDCVDRQRGASPKPPLLVVVHARVGDERVDLLLTVPQAAELGLHLLLAEACS